MLGGNYTQESQQIGIIPSADDTNNKKKMGKHGFLSELLGGGNKIIDVKGLACRQSAVNANGFCLCSEEREQMLARS